MAYEPNTWECGDIVTADKLNNLEEGVQEALECCEGGGGSEPLIVHAVDFALDKTWQEICDAMPMAVVYTDTSAEEYGYIGRIVVESATILVESGVPYEYSVVTNDGFTYTTDHPNGYPSTRS